MLRRQLMSTAAALALWGSLVHAQANDDGVDMASTPASEAASPALECTRVGLKILAAELSGARFACRVVGAAAADSRFSVQLINMSDDRQLKILLCTGNLADGAGACSGSYVDRASSGLGQVSLAATLQPSGSGLGPLVLGQASPPAPVEPIQFFPISEPSG